MGHYSLLSTQRAVLIVAVFVAAAGCGSGTTPTATPSVSSGTTTSASPTATAPATPTPRFDVLTCDANDAWVVTRYDEGGAVVRTASFKPPSRPCNLGNLEYRTLELRELFNADYTKTAAVVDEADGSTHVVVYDASGGETDLAPSASDFDTTVRQTKPQFVPGSDILLYEEDGSIKAVQTATGEAIDPPRTLFPPYDGLRTRDNALLNPDKPYAVEAYHNDSLAGSGNGFLVQKLDSTFGEAVGDAHDVPTPFRCDPLVWLDPGTRLICINKTRYYHATFNDTLTRVSLKAVLPENDFAVFTPLPSADETTLAFIGRQGQAAPALFTVPTMGGEPTKIADLGTDGPAVLLGA